MTISRSMAHGLRDGGIGVQATRLAATQRRHHFKHITDRMGKARVGFDQGGPRPGACRILAGWKDVNVVYHPVGNNRMTGIASTSASGTHVGFLAECIDNLALSLLRSTC